MRTTLRFVGLPEMILEKAVDVGLARSKTDALRMGIFALNKEYNLVKDVELAMVARKLEEEELGMKSSRKKYLSEKQALAKYRKEKALKKYSGGKISISEVADKAGMNIREFETYAVQHGFKSSYSIEDLESELK
ncbi:MAG: UPF0175 family protein [Candidatus Micrarchaeota archaeon]